MIIIVRHQRMILCLHLNIGITEDIIFQLVDVIQGAFFNCHPPPKKKEKEIYIYI